VRKSRIFVLLIIIALAAGFGYRVYRLVMEGKKSPGSVGVALVTVRVEPVEKGTIRRDIKLTGSVEAMTSIQVFPKCSGRLIPFTQEDPEKVQKLFEDAGISAKLWNNTDETEEGESVVKDQIIAVLDHENADAQLVQARAALTTAQAQFTQSEIALGQMEKDLERTRNLYEEGASTKQALDKIEAEQKSLLAQKNVSKARVDQSQAALNQVQIQLTECYIVAPISGIVSKRFLETGDMAMITRPIFAIIDVDMVKIVTDLVQRYVDEVREGAEASVEVDSYPGRAFRGTVTQISPTLSVVNRSAELKIAIENADRALKPGMFTRIQLTISKREGVPIVPEAAVMRDMSGEHVFVIENSIAQRRPVVLGLIEGPKIEIREGVLPGEMLVVAGQQKIADQQKVTIVR
jgi:RND family efflux transporter MFP subunit